MNSNKFNFYKNSIYFLIANGILTLAGIVVLIVCGFNLDQSVQGGHLFASCAISIVLSLIAILLYIGFRYDFAKALSVVLVTVHNIILSTALIVILRITVSNSILMGYVLLMGLTTVFTLILTEKLKDTDLKKADYNKIISDSLFSSVKQIAIVVSIMVAVLLLSLLIASNSMFDLVRELLVMLVVVIYGTTLISLPVWCFFSSKIKKIKRQKVDSNVENQKVVKAVTLSDSGEEVASATVEPDNSQNQEKNSVENQ